MQRCITFRGLYLTSRFNRVVYLSQSNNSNPSSLNQTGSSKVWSSQSPESIHVAPLNATTTSYIPVSADGEKTVHVTQGELHIVDPSKTHRFKPESVPPETPFATDTNEKPIQRENDLREDILRESLKFVDEHGWTIDAIRAGIRASNQPSTVEGLFGNGYDLIEYFQRDANSKMSAYMKEEAKKGSKQGTSLLIDGLKYRLNLVVPYANTWGQALAQGALPQNTMRSWKSLLDLSSEAWHSIGDKSTYTNWYTKRLLLATIYQSAEIFMLQDQSPDKVDTMNFLERRLNDFQTLGSLKDTMSKSLSDTAQITNGFFSVIRNLTSRR